MQIILNADDFGKSPQVNAAVITLLERGLITSATLLVNGPAVAGALEHLGRFPHCSFGVHLNVTEYRPLTSQAALRPLLDDQGAFSRERFRHTRLTPALQQAVYQEWLAQVDYLRSRGLSPTHLDSHHDAHLRPGLFVALKRLQRQTGIRRVRLAATFSADPQARFLRNRLYNFALRHFGAARTTAAAAEFADFLAAAPFLPASLSSVELAVHPGHPAYAAETALLESPWQARLPFPVELISYREL